MSVGFEDCIFVLLVAVNSVAAPEISYFLVAILVRMLSILLLKHM